MPVYKGLSLTWDTVPEESFYDPPSQTYRTNGPPVGLFRWLFNAIFSPRPPPNGPLVKPNGVYRSYADVYAKLAIIPSHHPKLGVAEPTSARTEAPYRIAYNVWKPQPHFKKSDPGEPDFRLAIVSARDNNMPTLAQLSALFDAVPFDKTYDSKNQMQKLKDGHKSVLVAVVDSGVISFLRFGDVGFGDGLMYNRKGPSKKGGRGGGRGGRGGGRGGGAGRAGRGGGATGGSDNNNASAT